MSSISRWFNDLLPATNRASLNKSRAYRTTRLSLAGILLFLAIIALVAAWYTQRYSQTSSVTGEPFVVVDSTNRNISTTYTVLTEVGTQNYLRTQPFALYQATLAFGILSLILGVSVLGASKQPFSLLLVVLAAIFIIILAVLIGISFQDSFSAERVLTITTARREVITTDGSGQQVSTVTTTVSSVIKDYLGTHAPSVVTL